ncbi:MAG: NAD(P)/FAD-dependent oxidoreductase [Myxococcota bacterium]
MSDARERPHVVVIGGGFGGLETAKALRNAPVRVTLIDRSNHHLFQPLLYQVALASLSPAEIAVPIRAILRDIDNCHVIMGAVERVDTDARTVYLADGDTFAYDYLIVAAGARTHYFGHDDWAQRTFGLKTVEDALDIRRKVLTAFEVAERTESAQERRKRLTFVVIGAGPTGVEVSGAIAELGGRVLAQDYRNIAPDDTRVLLLEGGDRVLAAFDPKLSAAAERQLKELGVEVRTNTMVNSIDDDGVHIDGEVIASENIVWAAGVAANPLAETLGVPLDRGGRIKVKSDCTVDGHEEIYAIGDIARFEQEDGSTLPGVSPVAMQQARYVARHLSDRLRGKTTSPFKYFDKGIMATIGRSRAVAQTGRLKLTGLMAWLAWLFVHLFYLVGFKNRVFVLLQWIWAYVVFRRGARLITGHPPPAPNTEKTEPPTSEPLTKNVRTPSPATTG